MSTTEDFDELIVIIPEALVDGEEESISPPPPLSEPDAPARTEPEPVRALDPSSVPGATTAAPPPSVARRRHRRHALQLTAAAIVLGGAAAAIFLLSRAPLPSFFPSPGMVSDAHSGLAAGKSIRCQDCHHEQGFAAGCLGCHDEVEDEIEGEHGFHPFVIADGDFDCSRCHHEHRGEHAPLTDDLSWQGLGPAGFTHPHVEFSLEGRHRELECSDCHRRKRRRPITLASFPQFPREETFLGLDQDCRSCHEDEHSGGMSGRCDACHAQDSFRSPVRFDHSEHFPLTAAHEGLACAKCHVLPERAPLAPGRATFEKVRGEECSQCHESPHRAPFAEVCASCHGREPEAWSDARHNVTTEGHDETGFRLWPQHAKVACEKCHPSELEWKERFQDPLQEGYLRHEDTCQGCHEDIHRGQFLAEGHECLDCHGRDGFDPPRFTPEEHAERFALDGRHAGVACEKCHLMSSEESARKFVGTSHECAACHQSPHGAQFASKHEACSECHATSDFLPALFDQARHEAAFPLLGRHRAVPCTACHQRPSGGEPRQFTGTAKDCAHCHQSPHGNQFNAEIAEGGCVKCHRDDSETFSLEPFDHEKRAGLALLGAHASARCRDCHLETTDPATGAAAGAPVRRFRGTARDCGSCHRDAHRFQFAVSGSTDCTRCHGSNEAWTPNLFDHERDARFRLEGTHSALECGRCHERIELPDGNELRRFKPLGTECNDCHTLPSE